MKQGDIVLAVFPYEERGGMKLRPCMVWAADGLFVRLVYITSKKVDKAYSTEVVFSDKEAAAIGLARMSRIDFAQIHWVPVDDVRKKIGSLANLPACKLRECAQAAASAGLL